MANNIEWNYAGVAPALAERDDVLRDDADMDRDEVAVWLGSDGGAVLYGTTDDLREWAERLLVILNDPEAVAAATTPAEHEKN